MKGYIVEAKSRLELRELANELREILHLENELWIPIVKLLDILSIIFEDFSYEIVPDSTLPNKTHADTDIRTGHIRIKESVYNGACEGKGRDRMTIAHEIGHFFTLCFYGFRLQRNIANEKVEAYHDPEWQAKCFAGEFMIKKELTQNLSARQIAKKCGVSSDAAKYQKSCE